MVYMKTDEFLSLHQTLLYIALR